MTRRKTFKKAEFHQFPNCFDTESEPPAPWSAYFGNTNPISFELGCGKAAFSYALAQKYPDRNFVGVDLKADRMWRPAGDALKDGIANLAFLRANLLNLDKYIAEGEADEVWITFPDPYPKNKQSKHRMVNPSFLEVYQKILKPKGKLHLKTDNIDLFHYSLEVFVGQKNIHLQALSFDLHAEETLSEDFKIKTAYEERFMEMGMKINYVCLCFKKSIAISR